MKFFYFMDIKYKHATLTISDITSNTLESQRRLWMIVNKGIAGVHNISPLSVSSFSRILHMILLSSSPALTIADESVSTCTFAIFDKARKDFVNNFQFSIS